MAYTSVALVEREPELARVAAALEAVGGGSGRLVVVEGPAGIGKSSVLRAACDRGRERGFSVLAGVAGEFERELGFGVVHQLFESTLRGVSARERRALLSGAAGLARPLLLASAGSSATATVEPAAVMHGLYWLAANLSDGRPLVLCVDDAQWCDPASLGWLLYLARRLDDLKVLLIVAVRSGEPRAQGGALAALADAELGERLELPPLSQIGSAQVVREGWVGAADDELCRACFEVTGGNPFLLRELVRAFRAEAATSGRPLVDRVRGLTPRTVSRSVIARLGRLPTEAGALARGLAVLGGRADLRELFALTGVEHGPGMPAVDALEREQIAGGRPVRFIHPLVGAAIYGEVPPATRALEHARAARVLAAAGADAGRIANHLLHAEPAGDGWVVRALREAARDATRDGAPEAAVPWLARALEEPPAADERALVLHELGAAELMAGPAASESVESRAEPHLADAVQSAADPRAKALAALDWGDALWASHRYVEAVQAFDRGIKAVGDTDSELALRIEAHAAAAARLDLGTCGLVSRRLERFDHGPPATPAGRLIAGVLAIDRALAGEPAQGVTALAERMLEHGHLPGGHAGAQIPLFAINALLWSDRLDDSRRLLDEMIAAARAAGSVRGVIIALCWRGEAAHRCGALAEAASDLATAVELATEHGSGGTAVTHALLAEVLVERGDVDGAAQALAPVVLPDDLPGYVGWNYVLHARGAMHAAQLDFPRALEDFLACGTRQERWGAHNPAVIAWRSQAALAHLALGDHAQAQQLAGEELRLTRQFGAPRAIGIALRARGLVERGERQITLLRQAASVLEGSPARLEHARALADLGGALRRSNQRAAAREPLREALELASRCGATPLAERARRELLATGARPRKPILAGRDALTPIERQAATMAAQGMSNPQIAQALFISRKTVEKRLSDVYRKLHVPSRNELAAALATPTAPPTGQRPPPAPVVAEPAS
jgi:DNA-binding CsgD family transcriptional regulator